MLDRTLAPDPAKPFTLAPPPGSRPSWSGLLQLSLVQVPTKAYPAVRSRDLPTAHLLHAGCGQRLRYAKHCPSHGPVEPGDIVRGYEFGPNQHLLVEPDELDALRPAQDRALRLERFLEPSVLDPLLYAGRSLYLLPDGPVAEPAYALLAAGMAQRGRWALARMVLGGHRQVVVVRPAAQVLVVQVLHYPELVRGLARIERPTPRPEAGAALAGPAALQLACQLIDAASGAVDWSSYADQTAQETHALLEAKCQGQQPVVEPVPIVLPLLQALQQSLAAVQPQGPAGPAAAATATAGKTAATTAAAGKAARPCRKRGRRSA